MFCGGRIEASALANTGSDARGGFVRYIANLRRVDAGPVLQLLLRLDPPAAAGCSFVNLALRPISLAPGQRRVIEITEERRQSRSATLSISASEFIHFVRIECQG